MRFETSMKALVIASLCVLFVPFLAASRGITPILWKDPGDISARDLFYGPGGRESVPQAPFRFVIEDQDGTNPKFDVVDRNGTHWKVKLGVEARPEVAAARLLWAVGYFAQINYLVPKLEVENMPPRLKRGQELVAPDGSMIAARLKRSPEGSHKIGIWRWRKNPFTGTRELNGLRVMMAFLSNMDLKDLNNGIFRPADSERSDEIYMVSDLGCSFSERIWPLNLKGNPQSYRKVGFIRSTKPETVNFALPIGPATTDLAHLTWYAGRIWQRWIARNIPRSDAVWIGEKLGQLSRNQIEDAFRAAGFSAEDVRDFTDEVLLRIAALKNL